jgi:RNA polymerase sigma-70 factor
MAPTARHLPHLPHLPHPSHGRIDPDPMPRVDPASLERLYRRARAERWAVAPATFAEALERCAGKLVAGPPAPAEDLERRLAALHLEDLALACACADGHEGAWEHFVSEYRPALYRTAAALDPGGNARDLADALYAELYGLDDRGGARRSLFRYFHGRSSLATWLRAVLAQRHVDRIRADRRFDPLPDNEAAAPASPAAPGPDPDRRRFLAIVQQALAAALARLAPRDRLRLAWYYAREMTLAEIGRTLKEHEATVSRHLTRTRKSLREDIEHQLRADHGLSESAVDECLASVVDDPGGLDLRTLLHDEDAGKESSVRRSTSEGLP